MKTNTPFRSQLQNSVFLIVFPLCYILIGAMFQFVPDINPKVVAIVLASCVVVSGTVMIARYFIQGSFRDLYSYEFSFGAFAVIAGVCMMIAASRIGELLITLLGVFMLMTSIIKVQNAIQLIGMKRKTWIPVMVIAVLLIAADVLVIVKPFSDEFRRVYTNVLLMTDGVLSFVINVLMHIRARKREKALTLVTAGATPTDPTVGEETDSEQPAKKADKTEKTDQSERAEKPAKADKSAKTDKPVRAGKRDGGSDPERAAKNGDIKSEAKSADATEPATKGTESVSDDRIKELFEQKRS